MKTFSDEQNLRELVTGRLTRRNKDRNDKCVENRKDWFCLVFISLKAKDCEKKKWHHFKEAFINGWKNTTKIIKRTIEGINRAVITVLPFMAHEV